MTVISASREEGPPRVGFVAGRKVGSAVQRNRAKRRLREAVRQIDLEEGKDYVVIATAAVNEVAFQILVDWLAAAVVASGGPDET